MSEIINEALIEMHYLKAIANHFASMYGANFLKVLKPSPQQEAWVGFDQGWVHTTVTTGQLLTGLKSAIRAEQTTIPRLYLGYFMQFKLVEDMKRQSKTMPSGFNVPYLRVKLSMNPSKLTGISQHETLLRLREIKYASVSYACALLIDINDIYKEPNLNQLLCVPLNSAPTGWATNQPHHIYFKNSTDTSPYWCSEPVKGKAFTFPQWTSLDSEHGPKLLTPEHLETLLQDSRQALRIGKNKYEDKMTSTISESFTLFEFSIPTDDGQKIT